MEPNSPTAVPVTWDDTYTEQKREICSVLDALDKTPVTTRAIQTVGFYIYNLRQQPEEAKFSTINSLNKGFVERVAVVPEAVKLLALCGFVQQDTLLKREIVHDKETIIFMQDFLDFVLSKFQSFLAPPPQQEVKEDTELSIEEGFGLDSTREIYLAQLQQLKIDILLERLKEKIPTAIGAGVEDNILGTFFGSAIGDILGSQVQDWSEELIKSKFGELLTVFPEKENTCSPIFGLSLLLSSSIIDKEYLDIDYTTKSYHASIPNLPKIEQEAFSDLKTMLKSSNGSNLKSQVQSRDNVFCLLSLPLPFVFREASDNSLLAALKTSLFPFWHDAEGMEGAYLLCIALKELSLLDNPFAFKPKEFLTALTNSARTPNGRTKLLALTVLLEKLRGPNQNTQDSKFVRFLSSPLQCSSLEAVATSLWFFLRYFKDPVECLSRAVTGGGDAGVIGGITGALLGSLHGTSWIPSYWFEGIAQGEREKITLTCKKLSQLSFLGFTLPLELQRQGSNLPM
eukprot:TRINITY_DN1699_c0_g1_i2.p1 TRINITY_DN1699_c0_g1~~TRINITY_DN1699_c0_g1_i2.p1  ORF type:complete len:513 (-),score=113.90 TRINITY_DN1699_c0_g1_i2:101-1639(-)